MIKQEIPVLDLVPEIEALREPLMAAVASVLESGHFIMGSNLSVLEAELANYLGVRHAIGVNSGTDALTIALKAAGVGPGDEVITSPFTFFATAEAIEQAGARPVFADIDPITYNLEPMQVRAAVTSRTRAVLPVHLYGHAAEMDTLLAIAREYGLKVIEDAAQAMGGEYRRRKLGTLGEAGAFSFFPSKNLGAFGDGGLIATDDDQTAETARMLRTHGARRKYHNEMIGYNSRLDELQAALLRVKLPHLEDWNRRRRQAAHRYGEMLAGIPGVQPPTEGSGVYHVYHQYTVRVEGGRRDAVQAKLAEAGIGTMIYYPVPLHRIPVYAARDLRLPVAERASAEVLALPAGPFIEPSTQERVVRELRTALG